VTLLAGPYTEVDPGQGKLARINGRRAELNDNTGAKKGDVPENCGYILEVTDKASVSVGVASGEQNESTVDECADAHRFATVIEGTATPATLISYQSPWPKLPLATMVMFGFSGECGAATRMKVVG
jgi:hypothetical protein